MPKAFVVLKRGYSADSELAARLKDHVKTRLARFKYPRWIEFVEELPKTATARFNVQAASTLLNPHAKRAGDGRLHRC
jgi:acyl-coenzyme A synthetase/AMP-(fatty) acid ligase